MNLSELPDYQLLDLYEASSKFIGEIMRASFNGYAVDPALNQTTVTFNHQIQDEFQRRYASRPVTATAERTGDPEDLPW